ALPRIFASVLANEVTSALAVLMAVPSSSDTPATSAFTVAWFCARARTVRAAVFVGVEGTSPSNDATVSPSTLLSDLRYETEMKRLPATLVACDAARLVDDARTLIAPPGARYSASEPTTARVVAFCPTCASPTMTATAIAPTWIARTSTSAKLLLVDWTVMPDEFVMSPAISMFVPPSTMEVGTDTPTASNPPAARSLRVFEWLFDLAVISTRPLADSDESDPPVTSTSAVLLISVSAVLPLPEKPNVAW